MSVSILGRNSSGMKKQRCSGFKRLIVATQGAGSAWTAISRAFVVVSAATRRTIACQKGDRLLPLPLEGEGRVRGSCHPERSEGSHVVLPPTAAGSCRRITLTCSDGFPVAAPRTRVYRLPLRQGPMRRPPPPATCSTRKKECIETGTTLTAPF